MQAFTLYGLDEVGRPISVEFLKSESAESVKRLAGERTASYPAVELWSGSTRLLRQVRRDSN